MSKPLASHTFAEIFGRMGDLPDLVSVPASTTVEDALKTMASTRVSCLAVTGTATEANPIIAVVGFHDVVNYVVKHYKDDGKLSASLNAVLTIDTGKESYRVYERDVNDTIGETLKAFTHQLHRALWVRQGAPRQTRKGP
jgi:CBS domain-containing protein